MAQFGTSSSAKPARMRSSTSTYSSGASFGTTGNGGGGSPISVASGPEPGGWCGAGGRLEYDESVVAQPASSRASSAQATAARELRVMSAEPVLPLPYRSEDFDGRGQRAACVLLGGRPRGGFAASQEGMDASFPVEPGRQGDLVAVAQLDDLRQRGLDVR